MIRELISEEEICAKVKELADKLYEEYGDEEVVFVCTLKGAVFFACELLRHYKGDARLEFLRASSYKGKESTGKVELNLSVSQKNIKDKNVVLLEDIVDTGYTLKYLKKYISRKKPASLKLITLLDKPSRRKTDIDADYSCFTIDDLFVVGFGLDYDQKYRNLPFIGVVEEAKTLNQDGQEMKLIMKGSN